MKILQLPAGYLARFVNTHEVHRGSLIAQVVAGAGQVAKRNAGARREIARLIGVVESRALHAVPPGYSAIHDGVRKI